MLGFGGMPVRAFDDGTQTVWDGYAPTTVMIDAGHGGMDSGAIAFNGQYEKDLSLEKIRMLKFYKFSLKYSLNIV